MDNPPPTFTRKSWTHSTSMIFQKCQPPTNKEAGGGGGGAIHNETTLFVRVMDVSKKWMLI